MKAMKALTLYQPWALLVALKAKAIETRSWKTLYRGPLAIHAAKRVPPEYRRLCGAVPPEPFASALNGVTWTVIETSLSTIHQGHSENLHLGCVIATCELIDCVPISGFISYQAKEIRSRDGQRWILSEQERAFGDYTVGRWAWLLRNVQPLADPIPAKGALGLWEWTPA